MQRWILSLLLLLQLIFLPWAEAKVPAAPAPGSGIYIQDYANVVSAVNEQKILQLGKELEQKTTAQLVVVTIPSLEGQALEEYSLELLRTWGIGRKEKNNGALLLIAINDRQSRFEVGYGLEGTLPDGLTGRIQDQYMLPYFRKGDYSTGIYNGYVMAAATIAKEAGVQLTEPVVKQAHKRQEADDSDSGFNIFTIIIIIGFLLVDQLLLGGFFTRLLFYMALFRGGGGRGGGGGGFGGGSGGGGGSSRSW